MGPHPQHLDNPMVIQHLVHWPMLDGAAPQAGAPQIADQSFIGLGLAVGEAG